MDTAELKAELLRLLAEDADVRAALQAIAPRIFQSASRAVTQAVSTTRIDKRPTPPWLQR